MKLKGFALVLAAAALLPARAHAQVDTAASHARAREAGAGGFRAMAQNANRNRGPSTGVSLGFVGFSREGLSQYPVVVGLSPGGPGEKAGMMVGDTIRAVNGRDGRLLPLWPNRAPGVRYVVRVRRAGEDREVTLVLPSTPQN